MELYLNGTSPYARVARIVALEKGLGTTLTLHWCDPWTDDEALLLANPVGRVPALITDEGYALSESSLIAQYLDAIGHGESLLPNARRAEVLALTGLGQGLMDAAFHTVIARKHQGAEADDSVLGQRRRRAIGRTLAALEDNLAEEAHASSVTLGSIVVAVALDYLNFRLPEIEWWRELPRLAEWHRAFTARESFTSTRFA